MKPMHDLMAVNSVPARINVNFEELVAALDAHLARYDTVVTAETVKEAKETAAEINKLRQQIETRRKEAVAEVSAPIRLFEGQMKELAGKCDEARQKILDQVKRFEDETRAKVRELLESERAKMWDKLGVTDEFQLADYTDLILLTSITGAGKLAASARGKLEERVNADKRLQDQTKMRLLELENKSYAVGLAAPLTRDHVKPFLFADDETYAAELQRILDVEVKRQEVAEQRLREKQERERAQQEQAERERQECEERLAQPAKEEPAAKQEPAAPASKGVVRITVTATFSTTVGTGVSDAEIEAELRRVMAKAGITTLASVSITRGQEAA